MSSETSAAVQLFELKAMIRAKIKEWDDAAERAKQPATVKWYRFMSSELSSLLTAHSRFATRHPLNAGEDPVTALRKVFDPK